MIHLSSIRTIVLTGVLLVGMVACQPAAEPESNTGAPPVLEMTALDYSFAAPDTIRSGWTTLEMANEGSEHHLFALLSLPTGKTIGDLQAAVYAPFDTIRSQLHKGAIDSTTYRKRLKKLAPSIPEWYTDKTDLMGGVGLTAPGRTARTTLNLEPGTYVMECYAKTADRRIHALREMIRPLIVTRDSTGASPPTPDLTVTLSKLQVQADSVISPGTRTVAVRFGEKQKGGIHGHRLQHLSLSRLEGDTSPQDLAQWMEWDPVMPAPVPFLGGVGDMPTGRTAYVQVDLTPGRYAWVLSNPPEQGAVRPFTVERSQ